MLSRFSCVRLFATPWTVAHQVLSPQDSSGKNTGVGGHALFLGIFPGIEPTSEASALQTDSLWLNHWGSPKSSILQYEKLKSLKKKKSMLLLSRFSRFRLCATP